MRRRGRAARRRTRSSTRRCHRPRRARQRCGRSTATDRASSGRNLSAIAFCGYSSGVATIDDVRAYWTRHIHDLEITRHPVGSRGFFDDLDQYHFEKLHHLLRLVDFDGYRSRSVLEVGCGAGVDLARFAKGGATVTGVDLARAAIDLARANFAQQGLEGRFEVADGEHLPFPDNSFDLVYAHGVVQYTADPRQLVQECHRVLRPGGRAVFQVYNRISWLNALSKLMKVGLEHDDAPVLLKFSVGEFRRLLAGFREIR